MIVDCLGIAALTDAHTIDMPRAQYTNAQSKRKLMPKKKPKPKRPGVLSINPTRVFHLFLVSVLFIGLRCFSSLFKVCKLVAVVDIKYDNVVRFSNRQFLESVLRSFHYFSVIL